MKHIIFPVSIFPYNSIFHKTEMIHLKWRRKNIFIFCVTFQECDSAAFFHTIHSVSGFFFGNDYYVEQTLSVLAGGYILISALVIFNVEPDSFDTFFDAVYWATVSLTTVGYGDIYPITPVGRLITMISSIFGIAIVALPAGIITAGYMNELEKKHD